MKIIRLSKKKALIFFRIQISFYYRERVKGGIKMTAGIIFIMLGLTIILVKKFGD